MTVSQKTFAILTPLAVEYEAVCAHIVNPTLPAESTLPTTIGTLGGHDVVCVLSGKGEANAAASFQYVCEVWKPRWVVLVGVAGGLVGLGRGDVIVGTYVYYLDFGKLTDGKYVRRPEYDFAPDRSLLAYAELLVEGNGRHWQNLIKVRRPDRMANRKSAALMGYIGSGNKVVDDPKHAFFRAVTLTIPELHAVEMEASGAGAALRLEQSRRAVGMLMIRGISDVPSANSRVKSGSSQRRLWKRFASAAAAAFLDATLKAVPAPASKNTTPASAAQAGSIGRPLGDARSVDAGEAILRSDGPGMLQYARVLLPLEANRVFVAGERRRHKLYSNPDALASVTEELLSVGCLQVAVPGSTGFARQLASLPAAFRSRVICVDEDGVELKRVISLFEPIAEELRIPTDDLVPDMTILPPLGRSLVKEKNRERKRQIAACSQLLEGTFSLFLALRHRLQLDIDIGALTAHASALRENLRSPEGRANMASLAGLLRTYKFWHMETFQTGPPVRKEARVDLFGSLWANEAFRHLSHQQYLIGIPAETEGAIQRIGNLAADVIEQTRETVALAPRTRLVQASVGINEPTNQLEHEAYANGFFPPIVPLRSLVWRAANSWGKRLQRGHDHMMFRFDGIRDYLPDMPAMIVTEATAGELRFAVKSASTFVNPSELDLFQAKLTDNLPSCGTHGEKPRADFRLTPTGGFEIAYGFCCQNQLDAVLENWEPYKGPRRRK